MPENLIQKQKRADRDEEIRKLYPALTLEEIANKFGLHRQRIYQIIKAGQTSAKVK